MRSSSKTLQNNLNGIGKAARPPLAPETLKQLYALMLRAAATAKTGEAMRFSPATLAGCAVDLRSADWIVGLRTEQGRAIKSATAAGLRKDIRNKTLRLALRSRKVAKNKLASFVPQMSDEANVAPYTNGTGPDVGAGVALALKAKGKEDAVMQFCDNALSLADTIGFAAEQKLPIVFVVNGLGGAPTNAAMRTGTPAIPVKADDVIAVYRVATEALLRARAGYGPTLVQCLGETSARNSGPLREMEKLLQSHGLWTEGEKKRVLLSMRLHRDFMKASH